MKTLFVKDLKDGMSLFGEDFAVKTFQTITKNNTTYVDMTLADNTGELKAKAWSDSLANVDKVSEGSVVSVTAKVQDHPKFGTQLIVTELKATENFNPSDFIACSRYGIEEMWSDIEIYREKISNKHLKALLNNIFDKDFSERFKNSAAAFTVHHNYRGGLMEHTLEILSMCEGAYKRFPKMNQDLLITGAILHDIGKAFDYETGTTIVITFEGKMLGHIFIGANYVKEHAPKDIPQDLLDEVLHIILSHHGGTDKGSPVPPKTAEAVAIAHIDYTSFLLSPAYNLIHSSGGKEQFTEYNRHNGTDFYRSPYLDDLINEDIPF